MFIGEDKLSIRGVYYLESENKRMNPIAIRPEILPAFIAWEDTGNGRILRTEKVSLDGNVLEPSKDLEQDRINQLINKKPIPDTIEVTSSTGEVFRLVKLTTKIFNEKLKDRVAGGGSLDFKSDDELQEYYLKANFMGY